MPVMLNAKPKYFYNLTKIQFKFKWQCFFGLKQFNSYFFS